MRVAIYSRVSTEEEQRPEVQTSVLTDYCNKESHKITKVYVDTASAADAPGRVQWRSLMQDAKARRFDMLLVWRLDRAFRSVLHAVNTLELLRSYDISFKSYQEAVIDTSSPMGEFIFHLLAAVAELERQTIRERVKAGLEHSRRHGTKSGKPIGRPAVEVDVKKLVDTYERLGGRIRATAREMGLNPGLVHLRLRQAGILPESDKEVHYNDNA